MPSALHRARIAAVIDVLRGSDARHVADLGCGPGELLFHLRDYVQFTWLLGGDIAARTLARARQRLGLDLLETDARLRLCCASFENCDWAQRPIDAAVLLETIEHLQPGRLSRLESSLFGQVRPATIVITTPNQEYNSLHGLAAGERRHPGHHFEWTRPQFKTWCVGVARRRGYAVQFRDIGPRDPVRGSSTQMASFLRQSAASAQVRPDARRAEC